MIKAPVPISSKQARSLPKIASVLFGTRPNKGPRAVSEQPPTHQIATVDSVSTSAISSTQEKQHQQFKELQMSSNANISPFLTTITQNVKGGLSAYEISPASQQQLSSRSYHLDDFHIVRRVGKGGFASVFLVRLKASSGRYFALKAMKKADVLKMKQEKQVMNEKNILKGIKHSFIVELYQTFQDTFYLYMVMEYIDGGDLFSYLRKVQVYT